MPSNDRSNRQLRANDAREAARDHVVQALPIADFL
jgi:hypothetical protein